MSFVMVNADLSDCLPQDRTAIYRQLKEWKWIKMQEDAADINTVWLAEQVPGMTIDEAMDYARTRFYACCKPNCEPKVKFEPGYNEAGFMHLML